jgi:hypothetical protein
MAFLVEVVARGGVTSAASRLGLRKSTVGRRLSALEERLGVRFLERSARCGVRLRGAVGAGRLQVDDWGWQPGLGRLHGGRLRR